MAHCATFISRTPAQSLDPPPASLALGADSAEVHTCTAFTARAVCKNTLKEIDSSTILNVSVSLC